MVEDADAVADADALKGAGVVSAAVTSTALSCPAMLKPLPLTTPCPDRRGHRGNLVTLTSSHPLSKSSETSAKFRNK